jgi:superoxide reductase
MTKKNEIYKCEVCGNIVEMIDTGSGTLVCCGEEMTLMAENSVDAAKEKHVPVVEKKDGKILVKVGEVAHPMEAAHYIEWIEVVFADKVCRVELKAGDKPEAEFCASSDKFTARAYCNVHGLWSK